MVKKIPVEQLRVGMFIHALDCDWWNHPFLRSKKKVTSEKVIKKIIDYGILEVVIDTSKGLDVSEAPQEPAGTEEKEPGLKPPEEAEVASAEEPGRDEEAAEAQEPTVETSAPSEVAMPPEEAEKIHPSPTPSSPLMGPEAAITKAVTVKEEIAQAIEIQREVKQVTQQLMRDVRVGKLIDEEKIRQIVEKILDSIVRNQDALLTLGTIRKIDEYTYKHSMNVCTMMVMFCSSLNLNRDCVTQVGVGALLHDIGKARIHPNILSKTSMLTEEESEKLKEHVDYGCEILSQASWFSPTAMSVVAEHHEHFDGTGYPKGLKGDEISIYGQVASIVNMYDILTSDRWYRKGMEPTAALAKLLGWSKYYFNEELVHRFIRRIGIYPIGTLVRLDNGLLAVVLEQGVRDLLHPVVRAVYDTKKGWAVKPRDIDLANPGGVKGDIKIVCAELPEKWKIDPKEIISHSIDTCDIPSRLRGWRLN